MSTIIFFIIIFIIWYKILNSSTSNIIKLLNLNDFQKVVRIKTTSSKTYYTAIKNGENYLIANIEGLRNPNANDIKDTVKEMEQIHYHYSILITKATCSQSVRMYAEKNEIQVMYVMDLYNNGNKSMKENLNNVVENKINSNEENPIKEIKGNSIILNLFKKPDRL